MSARTPAKRKPVAETAKNPSTSDRSVASPKPNRAKSRKAVAATTDAGYSLPGKQKTKRVAPKPKAAPKHNLLNQRTATSDTRDLQAAFDALAQRQGTVYLQPRDYQINQTLEIGPVTAAAVIGGGGLRRSPSEGWDKRQSGTTFRWTGRKTQPMLKLTGTTGLHLERILFRGEAAAGIEMHHGGGNLNLTFRELSFLEIATGVVIPAGEKTCANVTYDSCYWRTNVGVAIQAAQSVQHTIIRPNFSWCKTALDIVQGGSVQVYGGGCYGVHTFLKLHSGHANTRGILVDGMSFDTNNANRRTAWLDFQNRDEFGTYGTIVFRGCVQKHNQRQSDLPLLTIAPGARIILNACNIQNEKELRGGNLAVLHGGHRRWKDAAGHLDIEYCDGLKPTHFADYVEMLHPACTAQITRTGDAVNQPASHVYDRATAVTQPTNKTAKKRRPRAHAHAHATDATPERARKQARARVTPRPKPPKTPARKKNEK